MNARDRIIEQRMAKRRRTALILKSIIAALLILILVLAGVLLKAGLIDGEFDSVMKQINESRGIGTAGTNQDDLIAAGTGEEETVSTVSEQEVVKQAAFMAQQYDYQGAISLLKGQPGYTGSSTLQDAVAGYQTALDSCRSYPLDQVTHVFFHTLIRDTAKAFDGDENTPGYNQVMTTISEFNSIIQQMYEKGYVMVSLHDMCRVNEDGSVSRLEIRLPEGKIPFVLSQDDVSYYHYMVGDGFANKLIVDENGQVKNSYIEDDGSVSVGDYDMVPLIDTFVREHPDFSYHGHKGIIALTGYEGVLGYRTDEVYKTREEARLTQYQRKFLEVYPDFSWEEDVAQATAVANAMKAEGWEFASHTWGHINPVAAGYDRTVTDTQRWLANVAPIVGDTDVLIFAFGADIGDWQPYSADNQFFTYLKEQGFSIYCNVDSSQPYWVQFGSNFMRQGRRNLDGYRMYYSPGLISDLFNVEEAWDPSRPTPVPEM